MQTSLSSLQLDAFTEVARVGSFSAAADRLGLTQSALSQRVLNLEGELGTPVFNRLPGRLELTETGRRLLQYGHAKEGLEREFLNDLKSESQGQLAGSLRIAGFSAV